MSMEEEFWEGVQSMPLSLLADQIPGCYLFAKDLEGRHMLANKRSLSRCGLTDESQIIGRKDEDFYPHELCVKYAEDDKKVFETAKPLLQVSELAVNENDLIDWFITSKYPLFNNKGDVVGVLGMTIECDKSYATYDSYSEIYPAVKYLRENFKTKISIDDLVQKTNLSLRQFQRKFKDRFHMSVREYTIRLKIYKACELLRNSDLTISEITYDLGFYDQSLFSNQFKKQLKMSPFQYRKSERGKI